MISVAPKKYDRTLKNVSAGRLQIEGLQIQKLSRFRVLIEISSGIISSYDIQRYVSNAQAYDELSGRKVCYET
jgi:hypothetical protein